MKYLKRYIPLLGVFLLSGCFQIEDDLTIAPEGSGKVKITLHSDLSEELITMMNAENGRGGNGIYPPVNEGEARQFFPAKDFSLKVDQKSGNEKAFVIEASFKDVNALLASPYGRAHQLTLRTNGAGRLEVQALTGASTLGQAAQFKPEGDMAGFNLPGLEEARQKKGEMRVQFRITLPNPVNAATGTRDNHSVTWIVERAKCKDDDEFGARVADVLEASCSADGIRFSPVTPPRLGLLPFARLSPGKFAATATLPDTNKIVSAVKFVPCALHVTRMIDLSGEGGGQGNQAQLTGAIVLPAELVPQRWGEAKLEEVVDAKGNSLMPKTEEQGMMQMYSRSGTMDVPDQSGDEDPDETAQPKPAAEKVHLVTLAFKAPEWKVKQIASVKGSIELKYLGDSEVIKLSNAVPANLVKDMSSGSLSGFGMESGPGRNQIRNGRLAELGLTLRVEMVMVQSGMTIISLGAGAGKATLLDAQIFDADGRPWPTTIMSGMGGGEGSCGMMVAGKPKPPFSLAVTVGGIGASIGVPIVAENVPVGEN